VEPYENKTKETLYGNGFLLYEVGLDRTTWQALSTLEFHKWMELITNICWICEGQLTYV